MKDVKPNFRGPIRHALSVAIGFVGVLCIVASGGGGGGDGRSPATAEEIAQAKTLVGNFRTVKNSINNDDIQGPADDFSFTVDAAKAVTGKCSAAALDALSTAASEALDQYQANNGVADTYQFSTFDSNDMNEAVADVVVTNNDPTAGKDTIEMDGQGVWGDDDDVGAVLNTVDLTIVLPADSDTSTSSPLSASIEAEVVCPENDGNAGVTISFDGTITATRRIGAPAGEPTLDNIGALTLDGHVIITQTENNASIDGLITLAQSGCTAEDCTNQSIVIDGTLTDGMGNSKHALLGISKTATMAILTIGFDVELGGEVRAVVITFKVNISNPDDPELVEISIDVTGDDDDSFTITIDQFDADGNPTGLTIDDGMGGEFTIVDLDGDGPIFGTILINGHTAGTLEKDGSGNFIIRYTDGTIETLA